MFYYKDHLLLFSHRLVNRLSELLEICTWVLHQQSFELIQIPLRILLHLFLHILPWNRRISICFLQHQPPQKMKLKTQDTRNNNFSHFSFSLCTTAGSAFMTMRLTSIITLNFSFMLLYSFYCLHKFCGDKSPMVLKLLLGPIQHYDLSVKYLWQNFLYLLQHLS